MAFIQADIHCHSISRKLPVSLYFPTDLAQTAGEPPKGIITLLHGYSNNSSDWFRMSSAPRYAADNNYILVCPSANNSFYQDLPGLPFYTCLTQELPEQLHKIFNIPTEREKNFIAGLSMGGYGALRMGLANPDQYSACASFSGCVDLGGLFAGDYTHGMPINPLVTALLGSPAKIEQQADLFYLSEQVSKLPSAQQPDILLTCGRQDADESQILPQNKRFIEFASKLPLKRFEYDEWDGIHEWNFWDRSLTKFISFIQNSDYADKKEQDWSAT